MFFARPAKIPPFITGHDAIGELLLFGEEEHKLDLSHLLHGLWSRPVDLTASPVIFGVGVDSEFHRFIGDI